ncbi:hypothetical protein JOQ06_027848 [Pogonophryne albipinna]|uniref:C2H2-type domain-containing protein n=1 Tax=Pogonophryne albipinna TaxID=1090488 RepID=A0AAD6F222_9TELE|nr:hypothetical protein JOQ06_027848 [Pogonophryne albipinna]
MDSGASFHIDDVDICIYVCALQAELTRLRCSVEGGEAQREELQYLITVLDQRVKTLESNMEAERAAHLGSKFNSEIIQTAKRQSDAEECVQLIMETLQQHTDPAAKHDGSCSPCAAVLQLLRKTLETKERQIQDLQQLTSDQSRQLQELQQVSIKLNEEEREREREEMEGEMEKNKEESERGREEMEREMEREREESEREREREREESEREREREREESERERGEITSGIQKISEYYETESKRLLAGCVLLRQPQSMLGNFTWQELCDVINEQVGQVTSDLREANGTKGGGCSATETQEGQHTPTSEADGGVCARWLRSKRLSSVILSSMADLQGALTHSGSSPPDVMPLARSALSRLLDHLLDQSEAESGLPGSGLDEDSLSGRLRGGLNRVTPPQPDSKALVSTLQQHFLVFSQRLHSAEVERRGLRLEVANLKRGLRQEREESCKTVPEQQFHSVCVELRQALSREQEVQTLLKEQTDALHTHGQTAQSLCDARQEVTRKDRSLRILGKHLSGVQRERKHLEEELSDTHRRRDCLISNMRAAETTYKQVRESLVQSRGCLSAKPRPLPALKEHLSGAECIMGAPEVAACQTLLSSASQLFLACCSRIGWLEQEVSAHISHVTALRGELQDVCLRDNLAFVPVEGFPEAFPLADVETWQAVPLSDWSNELPSVRCTASGCSCVSFKPGSVQLRSCDRCGHGWVPHALAKLHLQAQFPSSCGPVEVALPGLVFDLSSLVLYGAQAVPVRLKILLDRLYSVLTTEQVGHILHTLGWSLGDYVRGYMLQHHVGKVLDRWVMVDPEEELLILEQFLRFGETRPTVELMTLQCLAADPENHTSKSFHSHVTTYSERNGGVVRNTRGDVVAGVFQFKKASPANPNKPTHLNYPGGPSLLLPFHFPSFGLVPPTKELFPPSKLTQCLRRLSGTRQAESYRQEGGRRREQENDRIVQKPKVDPVLKIKADPDKPNPTKSSWHQDPRFYQDGDIDLQRNLANQENTSSLSPPSNSPFKSQSSSYSLNPLPSFSSSFLCPLPTSSFSSSLHALHSSSSSPRHLPLSLCSLTSLSPAGGRKGRVCCGVCGKSFYDKGTLKIHYNAVHLKIKHRCTVAGCTMVFSSLRSRNRHSANPNPRLHTSAGRNIHAEPHTGIYSEAQIHKDKDMHNTQEKDTSNPLVPVHTLRSWLNGNQNTQHEYQDNPPPQGDSPPSSPQPLPQKTSQETNHNFTTSESNSPPSLPPLLPSRTASSLVPLVVSSVQKPKLLANRQRRCESGDPVPKKKKPRKSSMPVKIEREKVEGVGDEEEC